jgi:hypothetical protein
VTRNIPARELFESKMAGIATIQGGGDYLHVRFLPDGRGLWLMQKLLGNTRLAVSAPGDTTGFDQTYCYHDADAAWRAVLGWDGDGDPEGWVRHHQTMRRRPDGDPDREYVAP